MIRDAPAFPLIVRQVEGEELQMETADVADARRRLNWTG